MKFSQGPMTDDLKTNCLGIVYLGILFSKCFVLDSKRLNIDSCSPYKLKLSGVVGEIPEIVDVVPVN